MNPKASEDWQDALKHTLDRASQDLSNEQIQQLRTIRQQAVAEAKTPISHFFYRKSVWLSLSLASMAAWLLVLNTPHHPVMSHPAVSTVAMHSMIPPNADIPMLEDMPMLEALGGDHA